jgi:hypothetical protein
MTCEAELQVIEQRFLGGTVGSFAQAEGWRGPMWDREGAMLALGEGR